MRHIQLRVTLTIVLCAAAAGSLAAVPGADAAPVLVLDGAELRVEQEPSLAAAAPATARPRRRTAPARVSARRDPVRKAVGRAALAGRISSQDRARYLKAYSSALRARRRVGGPRGRELGYVVTTLQRIARSGRLDPGRMPALFLILERNTEWWLVKGAPASGARVRFGDSRVIFQYYPGMGLQLQPLANFGLANGYWYGRKDAALRELVEDLVALRVNRGAFTTWEYYFHFGGGSPPWISGMAQATAMQALARAGTKLGEPRYLEIARAGVGAFERATPAGVRVPGSSGAWYALYSFSPRLRVLNGMLQSLIGLDTFAELSGDTRGARLFGDGDRAAQAEIGRYDTGAWSLYSRSPTAPGAEADLNYHKLNRDFARRLCRITSDPDYCRAADRFTRYMREDPRLDPFGPAPAPARAGRGVRFNFTLSKVGRVGITIRNGGRTYLSTSAGFSRGRRSFRWVPPRTKAERTYDYRLYARDLAGNDHAVEGTIRVKAAP